MRTRLSFLIRDLGHGGAQRQLVALASALPADEFEVTVLHFHTGALGEELAAAGVKTLMVKKNGRHDFAGFFLRLIKAARAVRPHILHSYLTESNVLGVLLRPFLPGTRIIWGLRDSQSDAPLWGWLGRLSFRLCRLLSSRAHLIIANSAAGRAYYIKQGFPTEKIQVIPNGIDTARFSPDISAGAKLRAELRLPVGCYLFGNVARLNAMKDHATLLRAFATVCRTRADVHLVCVGGGDNDYAQQMLKLAGELGVTSRVTWLPPRQDMTAVYNMFHALVSSSSFGEGFPNVVAEAMSCGVPCVVTDVGDSCHVIGDAGLGVPASDPAALAKAMRSLLEMNQDAMEDLKLRTRSRITENFSLQQLVRRTREVLLAQSVPCTTAPLQACLAPNQ